MVHPNFIEAELDTCSVFCPYHLRAACCRNCILKGKVFHSLLAAQILVCCYCFGEQPAALRSVCGAVA